MVLPTPTDQLNGAHFKRGWPMAKGNRNTRTEPDLHEVHRKTTAF